ncbi:acyltransferase family protein [Mesorhizobium sp. M0029]|uniref:acyltransferase family protein n=1 Tax=Mesorhizobium sp. M0029 TaxID=2956850 RepID=UPI00333AB6A2
MSKSSFRPEIQGLRAIAVCSVALFHVWPWLVPGGYVGVDVFFVISGFLITGVLLREVEDTGRIGLLGFYIRRARRLLPAAMLVLLLVGLATPLYLPSALWRDGTNELVHSALQLENWRLAAKAIDYLAMTSAPSPVQHYWSLSIEEQFYVVWPGLIIGVLWLSRKARRPWRPLLVTVLGAIFIASLATSVWLTLVDPARAYFVTHTRIWELALGALLCLSSAEMWFSERTRRVLGLAGIASILAAAFLFSAKTPFPGYAALLPTVAAALVIVSGQSRLSFSAFALLKSRPFQFLGDISYSLYLWHWPIIVFSTQQSGETMGFWGGVAILTASVGLAAVTKVQVEDRFRFRASLPSRPRLIECLTVFAPVPLVPLIAFCAVSIEIARQEALISNNPDDYPGARSLFSNKPVPTVAAYAPSLPTIKQDKPQTDSCRPPRENSEPVGCQVGDPNGRLKVFLVGDSHAEHWLPAFQVTASDRGWNAESFTKPGCPLFPAMIMVSDSDRPFPDCLTWGQHMLRIFQQQRPDIIIFGQRDVLRAYPDDGSQLPVSDTLVQLWRNIEALGIKVVVIADTPAWGTNPERCMARDRRCSVPYKSERDRDPLVVAHRLYPHVPLVDFSDIVCPGNICAAVIGNVYVWRDGDHLTATYSRSMADIFGKRIDAAINEPRAAGTHWSNSRGS